LQLSSRTPSLATAENSPACLFLAEQRQTWFTQLPPDPGELWHWCLRQDQDTLLRLLAFCAARSLNAIRVKSEWEQPQRLAHANAVGAALNLEMRKWFTPTADNFFLRISKAQIIRSLAEAGTPLMVDSASLKKAELAARAEKAIAKTEWLPELLRFRPVGEAAPHNAPDKEAEDRAA
jgi:ParB family transcriptional regulator, chromosome partitioning protein